ncbi:type 2 periplasmic-binding domain-containing protein [Aquipseudomonas ullengensis]|uniref:ABC transporter substrate-binding protein n=1 Tax=Aquipseudomonas ullengensis TaxID=2759166 RepID=A0A7W4Q8R2_9GAMM|nr:hypothetical protein [Pseudomonas ullengensis]MBB2493889.1 hypothetical protein [Pseudomonas ullengensis]
MRLLRPCAEPGRTAGPYPRCLAVLLALCLWAAPALAEETWVVTVAELPGLANANGSGPLVDVVQALGREMPGVRLQIRSVPFARGLLLVQQGRADLHLPFLHHLAPPPSLRYGSERLGQARFALYSRRNQPLSRAEVLDPRWQLTPERLAASGLSPAQQSRLGSLLGNSWRLEQLQALVGPQAGLPALAYPYQVETDRAHVPLLGFPALPGNSVHNSLEKLMRGRIQGYVLAALDVEPAIDKLGLRGQLRAVLFDDYPTTWLVADTAQGALVDQQFSAALRRLKARGEYDRLAPVFIEQMQWQPWP